MVNLDIMLILTFYQILTNWAGPYFPDGKEVTFQYAENNEQAAYHLQQLIERSDCFFLFAANTLENCLSYDEWFKTLNTVAMVRYWTRSPVNSRCTRILKSETGNTVAGSVKSGTSKTRLTKKLSLRSVRSESGKNSASGKAILLSQELSKISKTRK